jgi:hypothetical protein
MDFPRISGHEKCLSSTLKREVKMETKKYRTYAKEFKLEALSRDESKPVAEAIDVFRE